MILHLFYILLINIDTHRQIRMKKIVFWQFKESNFIADIVEIAFIVYKFTTIQI